MEKKKPDLAQKIELAHRSSGRLMEGLDIPRRPGWWEYMKREAWIHLKRAFDVWWYMKIKGRRGGDAGNNTENPPGGNPEGPSGGMQRYQ
jgi:hypothetical protein